MDDRGDKENFPSVSPSPRISHSSLPSRVSGMQKQLFSPLQKIQNQLKSPMMSTPARKAKKFLETLDEGMTSKLHASTISVGMNKKTIPQRTQTRNHCRSLSTVILGSANTNSQAQTTTPAASSVPSPSPAIDSRDEMIGSLRAELSASHAYASSLEKTISVLQARVSSLSSDASSHTALLSKLIFFIDHQKSRIHELQGEIINQKKEFRKSKEDQKEKCEKLMEKAVLKMEEDEEVWTEEENEYRKVPSSNCSLNFNHLSTLSTSELITELQRLLNVRGELTSSPLPSQETSTVTPLQSLPSSSTSSSSSSSSSTTNSNRRATMQFPKKEENEESKQNKKRWSMQGKPKKMSEFAAWIGDKITEKVVKIEPQAIPQRKSIAVKKVEIKKEKKEGLFEYFQLVFLSVLFSPLFSSSSSFSIPSSSSMFSLIIQQKIPLQKWKEFIQMQLFKKLKEGKGFQGEKTRKMKEERKEIKEENEEKEGKEKEERKNEKEETPAKKAKDFIQNLSLGLGKDYASLLSSSSSSSLSSSLFSHSRSNSRSSSSSSIPVDCDLSINSLFYSKETQVQITPLRDSLQRILMEIQELEKQQNPQETAPVEPIVRIEKAGMEEEILVGEIEERCAL